MKWLWFQKFCSFFVGISICLLVYPFSLWASSLETLEGVLEKAGSMDSFLQNESLQKEYFEQLKAYQGDSFSWESYQGILQQLKSLKTTVPEIDQRLWEKRSTGRAFALRSSLPSTGREVDTKSWLTFLESLKNEQVENILEFEGSEDAIFRAFSKEKKEIEAKLNIGKKEREALMREFYQRWKKNPQYQAALSKTFLLFFDRPEVQTALRSFDADITLDFLEQIRNTKSPIWDGFPYPDQASEVAKLFPSKDQMLARKDLFPEQTFMSRRGKAVAIGAQRGMELQFRPLPRKFHGIFKGLLAKECVGGNDCKNITPERWATIALDGVEFHQVEKNGKAIGFVQVVPVQKGDQIFGSVDFVSPIFRNTITAADGKKGTVFQFWLDEVSKHSANPWSGLVVGKSNAINNAGVLETVRSSLEYQLGEDAGKYFVSSDPLADSIVKASPRIPDFSKYTGKMVFDAVVPDAGNLTILRPNVDLKDPTLRQSVFNRLLEEESFRIRFFSRPVTEEKKGLLLELLRQKPKEVIRQILTLPEWAKYPELVDEILKNSEHDREVALFLLEKEHWKPYRERWAKTLIQRKTALRALIYKFSDPKLYQENPTILLEALEEIEVEKNLVEVFRGPFWHDHPEVFRALAKNKTAAAYFSRTAPKDLPVPLLKEFQSCGQYFQQLLP